MRDYMDTHALAGALNLAERSVQLRAKRENWAFRPRAGRGGGREYLVSALPASVREALAVASLASAPAPVEPAAPPVPVAASSLGQLTKRQREAALARLVFVREIERAAALVGKEAAIRTLLRAAESGSLPEHLTALIPLANDRYGSGSRGVGLSRRRLYGWCALFADGGERALAPQHPARDMSIPHWAHAFLAIWQRPQKPSLAGAYREFAAAWPDSPPSIFAVRRFLAKMSVPSREHGRVTGNAALKLRPYIQRRTDELWPTDIYTADGTTFDAEIQHPLSGHPWKPEVTIMADVATRRIVGLSVGEAEYAAVVLDALRIACMWGGIPAMIYTDNGPGYKNALLSAEGLGIMARLDIEMRHSIPGRPRGKGLMERIIQTICVPAAKTLPTCSHADMDEDAAKQVFHITRAQLKKGIKRGLLPTFEEFKQLLLKRVDAYNATPHRALPKIVDEALGKRRHMSPDEYWHSFVTRGFTPLTVPTQIAPLLFMPGEPRKVRAGRVQIFNGMYFAAELEDFHGQFVHVRYDMWDSSWVSCWTTEGEHICTATLDGNSMDYFPLSQVEAARERRKHGQVSRIVKKLDRVVPGATVQLPEAAPTYIMMADSVTGSGRPVRADETPFSPDGKNGQRLAIEAVPAQTEPAQAAASTPARPRFWSMGEKYEWLMHNQGVWTDKDHTWLATYVDSEMYERLHTFYEVRSIAWPGYIQPATKS